MTTVLIAEPAGFSQRAIDVLEQAGLVVLTAGPGRSELAKCVADVDVLWVRLGHRVDSNLLDSGTRIQAVVSATTGTTHIDLDALRARSVELICLQGREQFLRTIPATAELTIALMLALLRNLPAAWADVRQGGWNRDAHRGHDLRDQVVGIVGLGRVGSMVAAILRAFGTAVLATDPRPETNGGLDAELVDLTTLLVTADIVSLHADAQPGMAPLLGADEVALLKWGALLVNTARGELLDETVVAEALRRGHIGGAALDVLQGEPDRLGSSPLLALLPTCPQLLITPHLGGCTEESMARTEEHLAEELLEFLRSRGAAD